jgi:hypothetical protein
LKGISLVLILLFSIPCVHATSFATIHLDLIGAGIREGSNVTFSGLLTTPDGAPIPYRTIFIEDDTTYTRPNIILAITTTGSDGKFLTFWNAVPKDNGNPYHFYAKFLGGKIFGYTRSETYESTIELTNQSSISTETVPPTKLPGWFKEASHLWHEGTIRDTDYAYGVENLIEYKIIKTSKSITPALEIPEWFENVAGWWANGQITDDEFLNSLQFLLDNTIVVL